MLVDPAHPDHLCVVKCVRQWICERRGRERVNKEGRNRTMEGKGGGGEREKERERERERLPFHCGHVKRSTFRSETCHNTTIRSTYRQSSHKFIPQLTLSLLFCH